ncbi:XrtA system polysaccharide deacetylase [Chloroflexota bacterium]
MLNALSFDVEDYYHAHYFNPVAPFEDWSGFPSRVVENTRLVLDFLAGRSITATFFVLGWVAEQHPDLVCRIHAAGHEIATHGYRHALIYTQTPDEFSADLGRSMALLQDITGEPILGHRASAFSITDDCLWALDAIEEAGLRYDSSVFPRIPHDAHGVTEMVRHTHRIRPNLWEIPVATVQLFGRIVPVAGGGYFRTFPYAFSRWGIRRVNAEGHPAVVYLHPWEFDPEQPKVPGATFTARFRNRHNVRGNERRLVRLCEDFSFAPIREVFAEVLGAGNEEE